MSLIMLCMLSLRDISVTHSVHESTPKDGRLTELITATTTALRLEAKNRSRQERAGARRLAGLFAAAQQADLIEKFRWSI